MRSSRAFSRSDHTAALSEELNHATIGKIEPTRMSEPRCFSVRVCARAEEMTTPPVAAKPNIAACQPFMETAANSTTPMKQNQNGPAMPPTTALEPVHQTVSLMSSSARITVMFLSTKCERIASEGSAVRNAVTTKPNPCQP